MNNKIRFSKVNETKSVGDMQITLLTNTEIRVKNSSMNKVINMRVDLIGLDLEIECTDNDTLQIRCVM